MFFSSIDLLLFAARVAIPNTSTTLHYLQLVRRLRADTRVEAVILGSDHCILVL